VGAEIGKSLFGKVYLGTDKKTGRKVAIKTSKRSKLATKWESPEEEWRLMRIATKKKKEAAHLAGPEHILSVLNFVKTKQWMYTVVEYCPRGDLFELISKVVNLEEPMARALFRQLLLALKHIHSYGIFHLDISLENLFLDQQDVLRLADFGCARRWAKSKRANFGKFRPGKWQYMCPEIFTWKPCYGELADLWSAGVCLFIMLTGKAPFRVPSDDDLNFRRLYYDCDFSRCLISEAAKDFLGKMLCHPDERAKVDELLTHPWMFQVFLPLSNSTSTSTSTVSSSSTSEGKVSKDDKSSASPSPSITPSDSPLISPSSSPSTSNTQGPSPD